VALLGARRNMMWIRRLGESGEEILEAYRIDATIQ
jgi:hypothetical protein